MTASRPADIAVDLRKIESAYLATREELADELDALDARWPTADEIADLRAGVARVGELASVLPTAWQKNELRTIRANLAAFLDRLDPPEPQADDDVPDWRALLDRLVLVSARTPENETEFMAACRALVTHPAPTENGAR